MDAILILYCCSLLELADVIKEHTVTDKGQSHRITIRRGCILQDTVALMRCYDEKKNLTVRFLGEKSEDEGGPKREYFMLFLGEVANNGSLVDGPSDRRVLRHNADAFHVNSL